MVIKKDVKIKISLIIFAIILSYLITSFFLYSRNTLYNNRNWQSTKVSLSKGVMGAVSYFVTPTALAHNKLNLGAWHGYQELLYKDKVSPSYVSFNVLPKQPFEFSFIFNKDEKSYSGIRFNVRDTKNNYYFTSIDDEFIEKEPIKIKNLNYNDWNRVLIQFTDEKFTLFINEKPIGNSNLKVKDQQFIGFRGGQNEVLIDDVVINDKSKKIIETFRNKNKFLFLFALIFAVMSIINFLIATSDNKLSLYYCFMINLALIVIISGFYLYYYNYKSTIYTTEAEEIDYKEYKSNIEKEESILNRTNYVAKKNLIQSEYYSSEHLRHGVQEQLKMRGHPQMLLKIY